MRKSAWVRFTLHTEYGDPPHPGGGVVVAGDKETTEQDLVNGLIARYGRDEINMIYTAEIDNGTRCE
jgi:hypothetical protein